MESSHSTQLDIFDIYRSFRDIKSGEASIRGKEAYSLDDESERAKLTREPLARLMKSVESMLPSWMSIFDELMKLMSSLNLLVKAGTLKPIDFSEFSCFYGFVFFVCREKGQKNITVSKAIAAWKLVLSGRFRLLNQWCDFVEKNHHYNISEDIWQQVLLFSRCVDESLESYDPKGAWPVLIDDFVEHMYRISGSNNIINFCRACGDAEIPDAAFPGSGGLLCLKRKFCYDCTTVSADLLDNIQDSPESSWSPYSKRRMYGATSSISEGDRTKRNRPLGSRLPCAIGGCLLMFAGHRHLPIDKQRRVSFM